MVEDEMTEEVDHVTEIEALCKIGDYTDFYSSIHHATNVGIMFRAVFIANFKCVISISQQFAHIIHESYTEIKIKTQYF